MCEQNRDGDSYRSPYSIKYFPPTDDAKFPCAKLRALEETLNKMFKLYIKHYYPISSWDSSNLITDTFENEGAKKKAKYNLISTVNLAMSFEGQAVGKVCLSGTIARSSHYSKVVNDYTQDEAHITNIGVLVEDMENSIRNTLDTIYCMKSKQIIDTARYNPIEGKPGIAQAEALKEVWKGGQPNL